MTAATFIKESILFEADQQFGGLAHYLHSRRHAGMQTDRRYGKRNLLL